MAILPENAVGRLLHPVWRSQWITRQLQRDGVDVYHGLSHELPVGLNAAGAGIRSVVTMHDLIFMRYPELYGAIDRMFYRSKYLRAAEQADQVVAISQQTRVDLETFFGIPQQKVQVIGQSCDPDFERFSLRHDPDRFKYPFPIAAEIPVLDFVMAVGSLTPRKNWHRLLDALFLLKNEGYVVPLLAVGTGKGAYAEGLRAQAAQLGLQVCWLNQHVTTAELAMLYRRASALIYPSVFEGFGIPILEAMTIGIPVVTSRGGCFEEVGGAAALYADPLLAEDLATQIRQVFSTNVRNKLFEAARTQIQPFSAEKICAEWMDVYWDR